MRRHALIAAGFIALFTAGIAAATHTSVIEEHVVPFTIGDVTGQVTLTDTDQLPHETVTVTVTETTEPPPPPPPPACSGYQADYFSGTALAGAPILSRCEAAPLTNSFGSGGPGAPVPVNNFSARYVGSFDFAAGDFTFTVRADDGVRLFVDGVAVIDRWIDQAATTYTAARTLTAGSHQVRVEFYESGGLAEISASWAAGGTPEPPPPPPPSGGFPDASSTGPTGTLVPQSGNVSLSTSGMVFADRDLTGCITVNAANVTIRNVRVRCGGPSGIFNNSTGLLVEDTEIICPGTSGATGLTPRNYTARRVEAYNCENTMWAGSNVAIFDSYIHDAIPYDPVTDPHTDGIQIPDGASNIRIEHNTVYGGYIGPGNFGNSAITGAAGLQMSVTNVLLDNNLLAGGGYTIDCPGIDGGYTWTNNRFSRIFVDTVGGWGPVYFTCWQHTRSGNVYHETGLPVVQP